TVAQKFECFWGESARCHGPIFSLHIRCDPTTRPLRVLVTIERAVGCGRSRIPWRLKDPSGKVLDLGSSDSSGSFELRHLRGLKLGQRLILEVLPVRFPELGSGKVRASEWRQLRVDLLPNVKGRLAAVAAAAMPGTVRKASALSAVAPQVDLPWARVTVVPTGTEVRVEIAVDLEAANLPSIGPLLGVETWVAALRLVVRAGRARETRLFPIGKDERPGVPRGWSSAFGEIPMSLLQLVRESGSRGRLHLDWQVVRPAEIERASRVRRDQLRKDIAAALEWPDGKAEPRGRI